MSSRGPRGGGSGGNGGNQHRPSTQPGISHYVRPAQHPTPGTTYFEDKYDRDFRAGNLARLSLADNTFPLRPGYGTNGKPVDLYANYCVFGHTAQSPLALHTYELKVNPPAIGGKLKQIIQLFLQLPQLAQHRRHMVTDFAAILVTLKQVDIESQSFEVEFRAEGEDEPPEKAPIYTVTLVKKKEFCFQDVLAYLKDAGQPEQVDTTSAIQALNILVNYYAKSSNQVKTLGSSKNFSLDNAETKNLGGGLVAFRGFYTSVRAATGRLLLNVNVCNSVFYDAIRLDELILRFYNDNGLNLKKLSAFLKKLRVQATHLPVKKNKRGEVIPKIKTIHDLARTDDGTNGKGRVLLLHPPIIKHHGAGAHDVKFRLDCEKPASSAPGSDYISVFDYFKRTYNTTIQRPSLPILNVGTREKPSYLPAQCCVVHKGMPSKASLTPSQTKAMIDFAVRKPHLNQHSIIKKGLDNLGLTNVAFTQLEEYGIEVDTKLIQVHGRILANPKVLYKGSKEAKVKYGSWNMSSHNDPLKFHTGAALKSWACLYVELPADIYPKAPRFSKDKLDSIAKSFCKVMIASGIAVDSSKAPLRFKAGLKDLEDGELLLDQNIRHITERQPDLVFVILPSDSTPVYSRLKHLADTRCGIHTVCAVGSKLEKANEQYFRNMALKVNLKLGGVNQHVQSDTLKILGANSTMIIGIDVTHPSPGSAENARSRAAMVASIDDELGQWPGVLREQEGGLEMVQALDQMLESRLKLWCAPPQPNSKLPPKRKALPTNIVVYRDGVSEGQYKDVLTKELPQLREACRRLYAAPQTKAGIPRISIIICGKRHHTRFFVKHEGDGDHSGNPPAGTVCDRGVTELRTWDFYLQAHGAIKGTAKPCHYVVLLDEIFRSTFKPRQRNVADELQQLTLNLSYIYGRATRAVSYCTPAYYADILCDRARHHHHEEYQTPVHSRQGSKAENVSSRSGSTSPYPGSDRGSQTSWECPIHPNLKNSMFYI